MTVYLSVFFAFSPKKRRWKSFVNLISATNSTFFGELMHCHIHIQRHQLIWLNALPNDAIKPNKKLMEFVAHYIQDSTQFDGFPIHHRIHYSHICKICPIHRIANGWHTLLNNALSLHSHFNSQRKISSLIDVTHTQMYTQYTLERHNLFGNNKLYGVLVGWWRWYAFIINAKVNVKIIDVNTIFYFSLKEKPCIFNSWVILYVSQGLWDQ